MKQILSCAAALAMAWLSVAAGQTQKPAAPVQKKAAPAQQKKTAPAQQKKAAAPAAQKGTPVAAKKGSSTGKKGAATRRPSVTWRNRQMAPSQERYREIQNALAARGYLSPDDASGVWNQASIDALKRFQAEQNIESSGKINSLSLIALGLGPKRDAAPVVPPKPGADQGGQ